MSEVRTFVEYNTHNKYDDGTEWHHVNNVDIMVNIDADGNEHVQIFRYGCSCGESYSEAEYAWDCKKCRKYLMEEDYATRTVCDIFTGKEIPR